MCYKVQEWKASSSPELRYASGCVKTPRSRHCERSEAIQSVGYHWIASVASLCSQWHRPRNDVAAHFSHNLACSYCYTKGGYPFE